MFWLIINGRCFIIKWKKLTVNIDKNKKILADGELNKNQVCSKMEHTTKYRKSDKIKFSYFQFYGLHYEYLPQNR